MRAFLGALVLSSVLALATANLKDIGVEQQRVVPFQTAQLYRPVVNFPCSLLLGPGSNTCVYHKLCVTLAGILKAAGCLLLLRLATASLVRLHNGKVAAAGRLLRDGSLAPAKLAEIVESPRPAASSEPTATPPSDKDESPPSQPQPAGDGPAADGSEAVAEQQQGAVPKKPSGAAAAPEAPATLLQAGLGRLTAVLAVNHALTSLSVKAIVPAKGPAEELKELCLPITAPPASAHLLSSARLALSSALHRYFPGAPFHASAAPEKGWQVPSTPYIPINYNGVSFANWASAMFCKKRSSRPPKAPCREREPERRPASVFSKRARRQHVATTTVFPAVPVPVVKRHSLTRASAPSMSSEELAVVNKVLDQHLDDVTSFLFD